MVFQLEGCHWYDAVQEIAVLCRHTRDHDIKATVENLLLPLGAFPPCLFVSFRVGGGCADDAVCNLQAAPARSPAINLPDSQGFWVSRSRCLQGKSCYCGRRNTGEKSCGWIDVGHDEP